MINNITYKMLINCFTTDKFIRIAKFIRIVKKHVRYNKYIFISKGYTYAYITYLYNLKHVAYSLESNIYNIDVIHQKQFQLNLKNLLIL